MSMEDWLRATKSEEQRLLGEIMKSDLYKQLEAVRNVLAVYQGKASVIQGATVPERMSKANILNVA